MRDLEVVLQSNGALLLVGALGEDGALVRLTFEPTGSTSLTLVRADVWSTASVEVGPATSGDRLLRVRSARSADDGVEGRLTLLCATGERFDRDLLIGADGRRRWTGGQRRRDGSSWTDEGTFDGAVARIRRRAVDADGAGLWSEERETTFEGDTGVRPTTASTIAERSYDAGTRSTIRRLAYGDDGPLRSEARIAFCTADGEPGATRESRSVTNLDGSTTTETVTSHPEGDVFVETTTRRSASTAGESSFATDTALTKFSPDEGWSGVWRETSQRRLLASDEEPIVTSSVGTIEEEETGKTISVASGTDERGNTSTTTSTVFPDGSVTIVTTTLDAGGNGTITTTRADPSGAATTETIDVRSEITIVPRGGEPGTEGTGPGTGEGPSRGPEGPTREGGTEPPDWGDGCPDDGEWNDCLLRKKEPYGQDSPSRVLPEAAGRVLDGLRVSRLASSDASLAARIGAGIQRGLRSAPSQRGGAGRTALTLDGLEAPSEWAELNDPVRLVDFALRSIAALARCGGLPAGAVHRSLLACGRLAREVELHQAREQQRYA